MLFKIIIIAIICLFLSSCIKQYSAEFSTMINICGGVLIFLLLVDEIHDILNYFVELYEMTNLNFDFLTVILKIVGIGYVTEFTADIAEDFGNKMIASKVLLGGKVVICGMTLPIIKNMLVILFSLFS